MERDFNLGITAVRELLAAHPFPPASYVRHHVWPSLSKESGFQRLRALRELGFIVLVTVSEPNPLCERYHCSPQHHWHVIIATSVPSDEWTVPAE